MVNKNNKNNKNNNNKCFLFLFLFEKNKEATLYFFVIFVIANDDLVHKINSVPIRH
jgi:hypothetical protein